MKDFLPVDCADTLSKIGLLVKARRLALGLRQSDFKPSLGVSEHTVRKVEAGVASVDLRAFMLVLWRLGITETVFSSLENIEGSSEITRYSPEGNPHEVLPAKRVRLSKPKAEDF